MLIQKNLKPALLSLAIFAAPIAFAQVRGVIGNEASERIIQTLDRTAIEGFFLQTMKGVNERDRQYVIDQIELHRNAVQTFRNDFNNDPKGLKAFSRAANTNQAPNNPNLPTHLQFAKAVDDFNTRFDNMKTNLDLIDSIFTSLPTKVDRTNVRREKDADVGNMPVQLNADLAGVKDILSKALDKIKAEAENLHQIVIVNNADGKSPSQAQAIDIQAGKGKSLTLETEAILVSKEARADLRTEIRALRSWDVGIEIPAWNAFTEFTANTLSQYKTKFGTEEKWRFRNPADMALRNEIFDTIAKTFLVRSYFRFLSGQPIGFIGFPFEKMIANFEIFLKSSDFLKEMKYPVWMNAENQGWIGFRQNAENAMQILAKRTGGVFKPADGSFLSGANAFLTYVRGEIQLAEVNKLIIEQMAADTHEEVLAAEGQQMALESFFNSRWKKNEAEKAQSKAIIAELEAAKENGALTGTLAGYFATLDDTVTDKQTDKDIALQKEAFLKLITKVENSPSMKALQAKKKKIFD
jgi:hypothetical protein